MAERLSFNDARSEPQPHGRELFRGEAPDEVRAIVFPVRKRQVALLTAQTADPPRASPR